jgi:hypothetical protein
MGKPCIDQAYQKITNLNLATLREQGTGKEILPTDN